MPELVPKIRCQRLETNPSPNIQVKTSAISILKNLITSYDKKLHPGAALDVGKGSCNNDPEIESMLTDTRAKFQDKKPNETN